MTEPEDPNRDSATRPAGHPAGNHGTPHLAPRLEHNIAALMHRRAQESAAATMEERIAERITAFTGSMPFVYLHIAVFGFWILANIGWIPLVPRWDPTLVVLAMVASVEAIFLSTFVLISQNRMAAADDKRSDLNLQISLLNEHETTRLITMVSAVAARLEVDTGVDGEIDELQQEVEPEAVLDRIETDGDAEEQPAKKDGRS